MKYKFDKDKFKDSFIDSREKFIHKRNYINFFPYLTNNKVHIVDFENVVGMYLCNLKNERPKYIEMFNIIAEIMNEIDIEEKDKNFFKEIIKKLYFDKNENLLKNNLFMIKQGSYTKVYLENPKDMTIEEKEIKDRQKTEDKIANYLSYVLGNKENNRIILEKEEIKNDRNNIIDNLLFKVFKKQEMINNKEQEKFTKIFTGLDMVYDEDFKYIMSSLNLVKDYLKMFLEFYYFIYTSQTCLHLNCFGEKKNHEIIEIYYSLEWEKTSQSRNCYKKGYRKLSEPIKEMFAHEMTLELLNQVSENAGEFTYSNLRNENEDYTIAEEIKKIRNEYIFYIDKNNPEIKIKETKKKNNSKYRAVNEYKYLFTLVKKQFEETDRKKPYLIYSSNFMEFCKNKFLKNRGRSGSMLNLTEEMIIFLTKLALKDKEKMKLNKIFEEFERRGIYLDEKSKEELDKYYEKLNLIEKKSDSGDAKYVKRIL